MSGHLDNGPQDEIADLLESVAAVIDMHPSGRWTATDCRRVLDVLTDIAAAALAAETRRGRPVTGRTKETRADRGAGSPLEEIRIAVRCNVCGHWLTDPVSVGIGTGPRCLEGRQ